MKIKILLLAICVFMVSCGSSKSTVYSKRKKRVYRPSKNYDKKQPTLADKVIWTAVTYKGTRYKYGGTTKKGIDCSGLVMVSFAKRGIQLPRSSYDMSKTGRKISLREVRRGDLLFFKTNPRRPNRISHVGLVTSVKNGLISFIHASTKRGVIVNNLSQKYYKRNFAGAKRVL